MGVGWGAGIFLLSSFSEFKASLVQEFELFWEFCEICDFRGSATAAWGLAANQFLGGEKNCIMYS